MADYERMSVEKLEGEIQRIDAKMVDLLQQKEEAAAVYDRKVQQQQDEVLANSLPDAVRDAVARVNRLQVSGEAKPANE